MRDELTAQAMNKQERVNSDTIIDWLKEQVENKNPIPPSLFLDAAVKLTVLLGDETDKLFELQQEVAKLKVQYMTEDSKHNVSRANVLVEASDGYRVMKQQQAKVDRIEEYVRISKIQARLKDNEYRLS